MVNSEDYRISFEFHQGSVVNQKFDYVDNYFDYSIVTAVFEILDDNEFNLALDQITRLTRKGIYTQDILDQLPGGYPRLTLGKSFQERNFYTKEFNLLFTEPFSIHNLQDPRKIYPNLLIQNIWVESD